MLNGNSYEFNSNIIKKEYKCIILVFALVITWPLPLLKASAFVDDFFICYHYVSKGRNA